MEKLYKQFVDLVTKYKNSFSFTIDSYESEKWNLWRGENKCTTKIYEHHSKTDNNIFTSVNWGLKSKIVTLQLDKKENTALICDMTVSEYDVALDGVIPIIPAV